MPMFFLRAVAKLDFVHIPDTAEKHFHNVFSACGANVFYFMKCFVFSDRTHEILAGPEIARTQNS